MPLEVSQSGSAENPDDKKTGKFEEHGKKFGKKMGNAGTFPTHRGIFVITDHHSSSYLRCRCYYRFQHCE